jgi:hypothetical protein
MVWYWGDDLASHSEAGGQSVRHNDPKKSLLEDNRWRIPIVAR